MLNDSQEQFRVGSSYGRDTMEKHKHFNWYLSNLCSGGEEPAGLGLPLVRKGTHSEAEIEGVSAAAGFLCRNWVCGILLSCWKHCITSRAEFLFSHFLILN